MLISVARVSDRKCCPVGLQDGVRDYVGGNCTVSLMLMVKAEDTLVLPLTRQAGARGPFREGIGGVDDIDDVSSSVGSWLSVLSPLPPCAHALMSRCKEHEGAGPPDGEARGCKSCTCSTGLMSWVSGGSCAEE